MRPYFKIKHYVLSAFREIFIYHHNSLLFRAKLFALLIAVDSEEHVDYYINLRSAAAKIYDNEDRINLLMMSTKEMVKKIKKSSDLNVDKLIESIVKELKDIPRYAKKIDTKILSSLLQVTDDEETRVYQERIVEFLEKLKTETYEKYNLTD